MSGFITLKGEDYLLNLLAVQRTVMPAFYVALITNRPPTKFNSGSDLEEVLAGEYARQEYPNEVFTWEVVDGEMRNVVEVTFPVALQDWEPISHWAITTSPQGGDVLWAGSFISPIEVPEGGRLTLPAGAIVIRTANNSLRVNL